MLEDTLWSKTYALQYCILAFCVTGCPRCCLLGFLGGNTMADYEYAEDKPRSLLIPVKNSDQAVEVFADEIPEDVNDIIDILRAEVAPLDVWLQFAVRFWAAFV